MAKTYKHRVDDLKERLVSLSNRIKMFEKLDIDINNMDVHNDLLYMACRILSHAESEMEDIYLMLYRIMVEQKSKEKEE